MGTVLDYAPPPRSIWAKRIGIVMRQYWPVAALLLVMIAVWPLVNTLWQSPLYVNQEFGGSQLYWQALLGIRHDYTFEVDRDGDYVTYAVGMHHGPAYIRSRQSNILAVPEELLLYAIVQMDLPGAVPQATREFLKATTGRDFTTDSMAWYRWYKDHPVKNAVIHVDASLARRINDLRVHDLPYLATYESAAKEIYEKETKKGKFTPKVNLGIAIWVISAAFIIRFRNTLRLKSDIA